MTIISSIKGVKRDGKLLVGELNLESREGQEARSLIPGLGQYPFGLLEAMKGEGKGFRHEGGASTSDLRGGGRRNGALK